MSCDEISPLRSDVMCKGRYENTYDEAENQAELNASVSLLSGENENSGRKFSFRGSIIACLFGKSEEKADELL